MRYADIHMDVWGAGQSLRSNSEMLTFVERARANPGRMCKIVEKERECKTESSRRPQTFYLTHIVCFKIILITCQTFKNQEMSHHIKIKFSNSSWKMEYSGTPDQNFFFTKMAWS